ncbi:hypothetical protein [Amycolatopsis silviterrae]|uniref:Uncharacterized protein n=1 Tax=Amycolatopsis silviterrae TaxID=1656914 RepID=A0ABW5H7X5_9PSEU
MAVAVVASAAVGVQALSVAPAAQASDLGGPITRAEIIERAQYWVDHPPGPYNQKEWSPGPGGDRSYRRDCSGYVSMAWHINADPSTFTLPNFSHEIPRSELKPGDILNNITEHTFIFDQWLDGNGRFSYYSFGSTPVRHLTASMSDASLDGHPNGSYRAFRYNNVVDDVPAPPGDAGIAASASYRYGSQEHMFSRGVDGSLLHSYNTGESIESESYPGELVGEPVALVSGDVQHVFALLTGDRLGHWFWRPDDADPVFEVAATDIGGNPSGYAFGDQVHVLARGTDNRLRHIYWTPQNQDVVEESAPQELTGDPVAYVWHDQQHVFARTPDGQLGHWWWTPADNEPQYTTWGGQIAGNPAGYAFGDQQHVYARTPEGTLAHYYWTPQDGVTIEPLPQTLTGDPVAYVWNDQQHVFARTPDDQLGHWWWTPEDNEPHYVSWGGNLGANPTGFATPGQQNVYGRTTDGVLTHWYWTPDMAAPDIETWGQ